MAQRTIPIAAGRLDGALDANSQKITNLATPTANADAANKQYVDENGGAIDDVKVNNVSVVTNKVANIDLTSKADATALTAEVSRATAAEATKVDKVSGKGLSTLDVTQAMMDAKANQSALTAEVTRATAAEALKRDKTDLIISVSWSITIPEGAFYDDPNKFNFIDLSNPSIDYYVYELEYIDYDEGSIIVGHKDSDHYLAIIDFYCKDDGKTYVVTRTSDTIAKTSEVNAGLATKVAKPTSETSADNGKYLKKNANGTEWATVQSGPSIVTSFPATPLDTDVPSTKLVKDSLDAKFDKTGGTISGDVEVYGYVIVYDKIISNKFVIDDSAVEVGENKVNGYIKVYGEFEDSETEQVTSGNLVITHTNPADGDETLTQRIVRDANVGAQITADVTHAKGASAGGQTASTINANGVLDVSTLFSGANTSLTSTIDSKIAAKVQNLDPDTASLADLINALKGNN